MFVHTKMILYKRNYYCFKSLSQGILEGILRLLPAKKRKRKFILIISTDIIKDMV